MLNEETEEELFQKVQSLPPIAARTAGSRFKFNPNPKRDESSIRGGVSLRIIIAAKIACGRSADRSCDQHEVSAVLAEAGIDMAPKRVYAMLMNLADANEHGRTASTIFIKVQKSDAAVEAVADDVSDQEEADTNDAEPAQEGEDNETADDLLE